jgi:hypothetical protein
MKQISTFRKIQETATTVIFKEILVNNCGELTPLCSAENSAFGRKGNISALLAMVSFITLSKYYSLQWLSIETSLPTPTDNCLQQR